MLCVFLTSSHLFLVGVVKGWCHHVLFGICDKKDAIPTLVIKVSFYLTGLKQVMLLHFGVTTRA